MLSTLLDRSAKISRFHGLTLGLSVALAFGISGCKKDGIPAPIASTVPAGSDPAEANMLPAQGMPPRAATPTRVLSANSQYDPQQQGEEFNDENYDPNANNGADAADQAPPPPRAYQQPPAPGEGYIWTPGYWGHNRGGYVWVQGSWARPPYQGALYTPGYWHNNGRHYAWHRPYWGRHVGFYGGVNYGYGYIGTGYYGGYWNNDRFYYNRSVNNLPSGFVNVYERPVVYGNVAYGPGIVGAFGFNGVGGVVLQPRGFEVAAAREYRGEHVIVNHGHPNGFIPGNPHFEERGNKHFEQHFEGHGNGHGHGDEGGRGEGHGGGHGEGHGHGGGHGKD